eukprot:6812989-Prymnesium_polylepis.1
MPLLFQCPSNATQDARQLQTKDVELTDAYHLISECLNSVGAFRPGRRRLSLILLMFHSSMKRKLQLRALTLAAGVELTFRFMLNVYRAAKSRVAKAGSDPVSAFLWAMRRVYIDAIVEPEARSTQLGELRDLVYLIRSEKDGVTAAAGGQQPEAMLVEWMSELELASFEVVLRAQREVFAEEADCPELFKLATVLVEERMLLDLLKARGFAESEVKERVRAYDVDRSRAS